MTGNATVLPYYEFSGMSNFPLVNLIEIYRRMKNANLLSDCIVFSQVKSVNNGNATKDFIFEKVFGNVIVSPTRVNPNSGNELEVFLFYPNATYTKWCEKVLTQYLEAYLGFMNTYENWHDWDWMPEEVEESIADDLLKTLKDIYD